MFVYKQIKMFNQPIFIRWGWELG